ncbi:MAG TPA: hypothetical protein VK821_18420 [Dehalococcoidia bacterium]|nr:hypothetical protein [Dehalococcoidia bacterium]
MKPTLQHAAADRVSRVTMWLLLAAFFPLTAIVIFDAVVSVLVGYGIRLGPAGWDLFAIFDAVSRPLFWLAAALSVLYILSGINQWLRSDDRGVARLDGSEARQRYVLGRTGRLVRGRVALLAALGLIALLLPVRSGALPVFGLLLLTMGLSMIAAATLRRSLRAFLQRGTGDVEAMLPQRRASKRRRSSRRRAAGRP